MSVAVSANQATRPGANDRPRTRSNHREHPAIARIEARECPCCGGSLGASDWPSWSSCPDCRCCHLIEHRGGRRYAAIFRSPGCRPTTDPEEDRT